MKKAFAVGTDVPFGVEFTRLGDVLPYVAKHCPDNGATYIDAQGNEVFVSFPQILRQANGWLGALQKRGFKPGDRILAEIAEPKEYHILFWTCVFGGFVPAPFTSPATWSSGSDAVRLLENTWEYLDKPVIITQGKHRDHYSKMQKRRGFEGLQYLVTDDFGYCDTGQYYDGAKPDDTAYIQFSSGTTGTPKGAVLTYENICNNCVILARRTRFNETDTAISWLPHTHNFGIFFPFVTAMMLRVNMLFMLPSTYFMNPYMFFEKISNHRAAWFCSNNSGLDWAAHQIPDHMLKDLDLYSLKLIYAGAENISRVVVERFNKKFSRCGVSKNVIRTAYGLSETTHAATITSLDDDLTFDVISRNELMSSLRAVPISEGGSSECMILTGNGKPLSGINVRIVDDNGAALNERDIGEVQIKGATLFQGYYGDNDSFDQHTQDGWLRTGDLGYLYNGLLFVIGRKKEVVVVRGINYMINSIEDIIYESVNLSRGMVAISSVINHIDQQEELIAFVQFSQGLEEFLPLRRTIINSVNEALGLSLRLVIPLETLHKTASGKLQRLKMRMMYENGAYSEITKQIFDMEKVFDDSAKVIVPPENDNQRLLRECWSEALKMPEESISIDSSFALIGGSSVQAYWLLGIISRRLSIDLDHEIIVACKTIREMDAFIKNLSPREDDDYGAKTEHPDVFTKNLLPREDDDYGVKTECPVDKNKNKNKNMNMNKNMNKNKGVAVTGMAFRVPGAKTQEQFWENLSNGTVSISKVSDKRKALTGADDWNSWLGEIEDIDFFDNDFFNIDKAEAAFMDPQQRILMEVAYEALCDAGVIIGEDEKETGVYSCVGVNSYYPIVAEHLKKNKQQKIEEKAVICNLSNIAAAQISHQYNFTGPVLNIDTACSSFLTSIHYAADAVSKGETRGALVMGANVMSSPIISKTCESAGIVSAGNKARVFDAKSDGTILGEGVVAVYLENLNDAEKNHKNIYGLICGSAVNNDGYALSVLAPNPKGQHNVLKKAFQCANLDPCEISYIEMHGTGTEIGDPIEVSALAKLYSAKNLTRNEKSVPIGSVKPNIGHLLWASGGAALIKVLLCMKNKSLAPTPNLEVVNPLLEIGRTPFRIPVKTEGWEMPDGKDRKAGITALGLGGTNAHIIVGEYSMPHLVSEKKKRHILVVSAKSPGALDEIVNKTTGFIRNADTESLANLCFTSARYRRHYEYRAACILDAHDNMGHFVKSAKRKAKSIIRTGFVLYDFGWGYTAGEFTQLACFFTKLKSAVKWGVFFCGKGSGQIMCDWLNGVIDSDTATQKYINREHSVSASENSNTKNLDVIVHIGNIGKIGNIGNIGRIGHIGHVGHVGHIEHVGHVGHQDEGIQPLFPLENSGTQSLFSLENSGIQPLFPRENSGIQPLFPLENSDREIFFSIGSELPEEERLYELIKALYLMGVDFNWETVYTDGSGRVINIPAYPFERKPIWLKCNSEESVIGRNRQK